MTRTNARLLSTLALVLTLAVTQQAYGQVDSIMDKQYEWCGISVKVPDGFRAEEADMIWKPNKPLSTSTLGASSRSWPKAMTAIAFCCTQRHCIGLSRKVKRTGWTDRWP